MASRGTHPRRPSRDDLDEVIAHDGPLLLFGHAAGSWITSSTASECAERRSFAVRPASCAHGFSRSDQSRAEIYEESCPQGAPAFDRVEISAGLCPTLGRCGAGRSTASLGAPKHHAFRGWHAPFLEDRDTADSLVIPRAPLQSRCSSFRRRRSPSAIFPDVPTGGPDSPFWHARLAEGGRGPARGRNPGGSPAVYPGGGGRTRPCCLGPGLGAGAHCADFSLDGGHLGVHSSARYIAGRRSSGEGKL